MKIKPCTSSVTSSAIINRREWLSATTLASLSTSVFQDKCLADEGSNPTHVSLAQLRVWDNHCHLSSVDGATPSERMTTLLNYADRFGIERLIVYMGWPFVHDPDPAELRRQNDQVLAAIEGREDHVLAYAYVSGNHPEASLEEMRRSIENGPMVGIKLWVARRCDDAALDAIVNLAAELDAVVFQHTWIKTTGNLSGESTPEDVARLAQRHPQAKIICGHAGGTWEMGIRAIRPYENVSLGIAGCDPMVGMVEMGVRELGAERIVYGSDAAGRSFASQLAKVLGASVTDQQRRLIFGGNLRRLLGPIVSAKGMTAG